VEAGCRNTPSRGLRIVHGPELLPEVPHEPREQWSGLGVLLAYAHEHGAEYGVARCHAVGLVEISGFELVVRPTAAGGAGNILDLGYVRPNKDRGRAQVLNGEEGQYRPSEERVALGGGTDVPVRKLLGRRSGEGREPARDRTDVPREGECVTASFRRPMSLFLGVARFFGVSPPKKKQNKKHSR
jgi:hypothetical protein